MGDFVNNFDTLKELGFLEPANQWILYDSRFQEFFDFFKENITEANFLTEQEALEYAELEDEIENFNESDQKQKLEEFLPGISECTEDEAIMLSKEIAAHSEAEQGYIHILEEASVAKSEANTYSYELDHQNNVLETQAKDKMTECFNHAKQLDVLQTENKELYKEVRNCFAEMQPSPLLFHQLPLEQYFIKCDTFLQHFTLYIKDNYKIEEFSKIDAEESETEKLRLKLDVLKNSIAEINMKYCEEKIKIEANQSMIDELESRQIHVVSIDDLRRELSEIRTLVEHLKVSNEILLNDLKAVIDQHARQRIEYVLYENTKYKLSRAEKRLKNSKELMKITSDAMANAEILWIAIQFDLERSAHINDNTKYLKDDSQAWWKRIKAMINLNKNIGANNNLTTAGFLKSFADMLAESSITSSSSQQRSISSSETKSCLYEYEKFCRLLAHVLQKMLSDRAYTSLMEQLRELNNLEILLEPLVYDSPIEAPILYNVDFLRPIYKSKLKRIEFEKTLRQFRLQIQTKIEKMKNDNLYRASQLLWIWFLKDQSRLLMAMEEVKRAAEKFSSTSSAKKLSGIKRK